jgi:glycosyltransferase involved in cell wall biosynthesis
MRVLLINKFLYPKGGDAVVTLNTGNLLKQHGHPVDFWGMKSSKNGNFPHSDLFIDEIDLNASPGIMDQFKIAGNMLYSLEAKTKLEKYIQLVGKPDVVHLHNFAHQISPSIIDVLRKHRIPSVMTMHDYKLVCASYMLLSKDSLCEKCANGSYGQCFKQGCVKDSKAKSLLNTIEMVLHHSIMHIYDGINLFISPSRFLKDKLYTMGFKNPVEYLPNFIDTTDYIPQFERVENSICYVGRISREKGVETLINAVKNLKAVHLKIIGDGPLREQLQKKLTDENITNVRFLGYLSAQDIRHELGRSCFSVCPSQWYENNPRSIIESFAMGKPVVGARIGGIPELVRDHQTGLTFEQGDTDGLKKAIVQLINDPEHCMQMGKTAHQWVKMYLNSDQHYMRLMEIYMRAVNSHRRKRAEVSR